MLDANRIPPKDSISTAFVFSGFAGFAALNCRDFLPAQCPLNLHFTSIVPNVLYRICCTLFHQSCKYTTFSIKFF